jgi:hypothetical protein
MATVPMDPISRQDVPDPLALAPRVPGVFVRYDFKYSSLSLWIGIQLRRVLVKLRYWVGCIAGYELSSGAASSVPELFSSQPSKAMLGVLSERL